MIRRFAFVFWHSCVGLNCADLTYNDISYSTCQVHVDRDQIALFLYDENGQPHGQFVNLVEDLSNKGTEVLQ